MKALILAALLAAGPALAQTPAPAAPPLGAIPTSRPLAEGPGPALPEPARFTSRRVVTIGGKRVAYTAVAGDTRLYDRSGEPIGSIFAFSYIKDGAPPERPVLFIFNGGPGSSSLWLHMGAVGPRRVVLDREVDPTNTPPFGLQDNPYSLLDVADLVFIDPVGAGWSRVIGKGRPADFWGVDEDADSIAQFIELWLTEHGRWNAPKYVMGESYGSVRAAVLPRALMGGPTYVGLMRGITLDGIILLGTTLEARGGADQPEAQLVRQARSLPAMADTAWSHQRIERKGRDLEAFHQDVLAFANGDYLAALKAQASGALSAEARSAIAARLAAYTGLPADAWAGLKMSEAEFGRRLLADRGLQVGAYDSRYTLPLPQGFTDPVADDPAMGRYVPGFVAAFHQMARQDLGVRLERPYGAIVWKDLLPAWNWNRAGVPPGQSYAADLATAMRRTPNLRVMVASGYFDLVTTSAAAEAAVREAGLPSDRVTLKRYASGHMLYLGDTAEAFSNDVRAFIQARSAAQSPAPPR